MRERSTYKNGILLVFSNENQLHILSLKVKHPHFLYLSKLYLAMICFYWYNQDDNFPLMISNWLITDNTKSRNFQLQGFNIK